MIFAFLLSLPACFFFFFVSFPVFLSLFLFFFFFGLVGGDVSLKLAGKVRGTSEVRVRAADEDQVRDAQSRSDQACGRCVCWPPNMMKEKKEIKKKEEEEIGLVAFFILFLPTHPHFRFMISNPSSFYLFIFFSPFEQQGFWTFASTEKRSWRRSCC